MTGLLYLFLGVPLAWGFGWFLKDQNQPAPNLSRWKMVACLIVSYVLLDLLNWESRRELSNANATMQQAFAALEAADAATARAILQRAVDR